MTGKESDEFEKLVETVAKLRAPGGCPWDRAQTHESLKRFVIEETYEVVEAIDSGDTSRLKDELGDLLLQVLLHAQIASEAGRFDIGDVCRTIREKLQRRHPHVFADT
ncbi:MAG: MazG nucleotide pyrophosphohydrolase domain-containing protein, partial [Armatimonadota bacterium]